MTPGIDSQTWQDVIYLAAIVLLPLIPAFILYATLPGHAHTVGPFRGLRIDLSGAFAGYFVLVLVLGPIAVQWHKRVNTFERWTIAGQLQATNGARPKGGYTRSGFSLLPDYLTVNQDTGLFQVGIVVPFAQDARDFPVLTIDYDECAPITLALGSPQPTDEVTQIVDNKQKRILFPGVIPLQRRDQ